MPTGNAIQTATVISGGGGSGTSTVTIALLDATGTVNVSNATAPGAAGSVLTSSDTTDAIWSTTTGTVGAAGVAGFATNAGTATTSGFATNAGTSTIAGNAGTATVSGTATVANALNASGGTVNVAGATAPGAAGSVLTSVNGNGTANWSTTSGTVGAAGFSTNSGTATTTSGTATWAMNLSDGTSLIAYLAPKVATLTMAATITVDASLANDYRLTLTASTATMGNPTNPVDGQNIKMQLTQDTTGNRTIAAWGTSYDFGAAGTPVLSTATSTIDVIGFVYNSTKTKWLYLGSVLGF